MREQLATYKYVFNDYDSAISKFIDFIRYSVTNPNLKKYLPHHLKRLWKESNNEYDLYDIITHVATDYEGIVREIYRNNFHQEMPYTKGLKEVVSNLPDLNKWQQDNWTPIKILR